jgi:polysaccharide biosynthesis protein PslH
MRFLLASHSLPEPPIFGGTQRTHLIHRALAQIGDVDFVLVKTGPEISPEEQAELPNLPRVVGVLEAHRHGEPPARPIRLLSKISSRAANRVQRQTAGLERHFFDSRLRSWCEANLSPNRYDLLIARELPSLARINRRHGLPAVLDFDDVIDRYVESEFRAAHAGRLPFAGWLTARMHGVLMRRTIRQCAHIWFVSARDRARFRHHPGSILPNIPFHGVRRLDPPDPREPPTLLFVGMLNYYPNGHGVSRFLATAWPRVRAAVPHARLHLAGTVRDDQRHDWSVHPGVCVLGRVGDLAPYYAGAAACIAPIHFGGGTNIKVLEAGAFGRACVVTPFSHKGFEEDLRDGEAVLCGRDEGEFADHCVRLLRDPALALSMGAVGQAVVASRYSRDAFTRIVHEGVESALAHAGSGQRTSRTSRSQSSG